LLHRTLAQERTNGMLRSLRTRLQHAREETRLVALDVEARAQQNASSLDAQVVELQGRLVAADSERSKLAEEKRKLYAMYIEFRNKFATLVETKAKMQADLLRSEEERLAVSKLLIELQMESNEGKELSATEKYRLETRLLLLEGEIVEAKAREDNLAEEKGRLQAEIKARLANSFRSVVGFSLFFPFFAMSSGFD